MDLLLYVLARDAATRRLESLLLDELCGVLGSSPFLDHPVDVGELTPVENFRICI